MPTHGLLVDLEGVLYQGNVAISRAQTALRQIAERGLDLRYLTNTTTLPRSEIVARLRSMDFDAELSQVFAPARAAGQALVSRGFRRVHLAAPSALREDFADFELVDETPEAVVMGDLHTRFSWNYLDRLFRMMIDGAQLIALHKNRYCRREDRLALDLGPFVAALEYATGSEALVVGKPSGVFFESAIKSLGLDRSEVVMIGDDIEADIGGALAAGLRAIQVRTGKYNLRDDDPLKPQPTARLSSITDLPQWLDRQP